MSLSTLVGINVPVAKLIAFGLAMVLSGVLWVFLHDTDLGKAMRASAQNREVAMLMGINPNRVFCIALGVALALAGAAGSLLMPSIRSIRWSVRSSCLWHSSRLSWARSATSSVRLSPV